MSQDLYVLCKTSLSDFEELQYRVELSGFDLRIERTGTLAQHEGHLAARWQDREAGFEFSTVEFKDLFDAYPEFNLQGPWLQAYAFYFGTLSGCIGANITAAVLAKSTSGILFDPQEGEIMSGDKAETQAKQLEKDFYNFGFS